MFTGLIETIGTLSDIRSRGNYRILRITTPEGFGPLSVGESISCDGACLTVVEFSPGVFTVEASQETGDRTILSSYRHGSSINLERALKVGDRLGGHFVTGHVDTVGQVSGIRSIGESVEIGVRFDREFGQLVVEKGSVALNGVSLTVNQCTSESLSVNIIPHTLIATTLGGLTVDSPVNIEFDMLGKYLLKAAGVKESGGLKLEKLLSSGW